MAKCTQSSQHQSRLTSCAKFSNTAFGMQLWSFCVLTGYRLWPFVLGRLRCVPRLVPVDANNWLSGWKFMIYSVGPFPWCEHMHCDWSSVGLARSVHSWLAWGHTPYPRAWVKLLSLLNILFHKYTRHQWKKKHKGKINSSKRAQREKIDRGDWFLNAEKWYLSILCIYCFFLSKQGICVSHSVLWTQFLWCPLHVSQTFFPFRYWC